MVKSLKIIFSSLHTMQFDKNTRLPQRTMYVHIIINCTIRYYISWRHLKMQQICHLFLLNMILKQIKLKGRRKAFSLPLCNVQYLHQKQPLPLVGFITIEHGKSVARWKGVGTAKGGIFNSQSRIGVSQITQEAGSQKILL